VNNLTFLKNYNPNHKDINQNSNRSKSPIPSPNQSQNQSLNQSQNDDIQTRQKGASVHKGHKLNNLTKESLDIIKKSGAVIDNKDTELSKKMLATKGIEKHFRNVPKTFLESRMAHGFLGKRHKSNFEKYQRRWFFLVSSRPLTDKGYENDDQVLEEKVLPSFLSFDIIYYYKVENENDNSEKAGDIPLL